MVFVLLKPILGVRIEPVLHSLGKPTSIVLRAFPSLGFAAAIPFGSPPTSLAPVSTRVLPLNIAVVQGLLFAFTAAWASSSFQCCRPFTRAGDSSATAHFVPLSSTL